MNLYISGEFRLPIMDRTYVAENNIIERYLMNKLSPDERDEFEQFYLDDPQTLDELEMAKRLIDGLKKIKAEDDSKS